MELGMVGHACDSSAQEAKAVGLLSIQGQPGLHSQVCG